MNELPCPYCGFNCEVPPSNIEEKIECPRCKKISLYIQQSKSHGEIDCRPSPEINDGSRQMSELKHLLMLNKNMSWVPCYLKSEVDKALAGFKAKLENVQARAYAESVDAWIRERRLRRALWLARAERAKDRAATCDDFAYLGDTERDINMALARTWMKCRLLKSSEWSKVWRNVERKCRAKAERFKG